MSSIKRDYYEILSVEKTADGDTIKKSYRKLAMQYHPDRNPGDQSAEEKFKEAAEAYEVLSNEEKRQKYDRFGHDAFGGGRGGGGGGFTDMNDIFSQFGDVFGDLFGGGGGGGGRQSSRQRNSPRKGSDLRYLTEIDLLDVIKGKEQNIEFDTQDNCDVCNGSGAEKGSSPKTCPTCNGQGQVVRQQGFFTMASPCPKCQGTGEIIDNPCKPCKGQGRVKAHRKIKVTIPAGVDNGTRLRVSSEGEGGYKGGPAGDLFVEIRVKDDEIFTREQDHLFAELDIPYTQFLLGGELTTEALDGDVDVEIPRGSKPGQRIKIANRGVPSLRGSRRGDLYYTLNVEFPEKLDEEDETLLRQIAKKNNTNVLAEKKGLFGKKK